MSPTLGTVFNIQKFSIHDGPGIRTLVLFKGCPLRCRWCCNPESQSPLPEHGYNPEKCFGCGRCVARCSRGVLSLNEERRLEIRRDLCHGECPDCAKVCPDKALVFYGRPYTVAEVMKVVEQDALFYTRSGGGLTVSGGEPLMQPEFLHDLCAEARRRRIDVAMETSGYAPEDVFLSAMPLIGHLLMDVKHLDDDVHRRVTGVSNRLILSNLQALRREFPHLPLRIRTPVIPGVNDSEDNLKATAELARSLGAEYELLPYHSKGRSKYASLGRPYPMGDVQLSKEAFAALQNCVSSL